VLGNSDEGDFDAALPADSTALTATFNNGLVSYSLLPAGEQSVIVYGGNVFGSGANPGTMEILPEIQKTNGTTTLPEPFDPVPVTIDSLENFEFPLIQAANSPVLFQSLAIDLSNYLFAQTTASLQQVINGNGSQAAQALQAYNFLETPANQAGFQASVVSAWQQTVPPLLTSGSCSRPKFRKSRSSHRDNKSNF
jgi:hypothetical protein